MTVGRLVHSLGCSAGYTVVALADCGGRGSCWPPARLLCCLRGWYTQPLSMQTMRGLPSAWTVVYHKPSYLHDAYHSAAGKLASTASVTLSTDCPPSHLHRPPSTLPSILPSLQPPPYWSPPVRLHVSLRSIT